MNTAVDFANGAAAGWAAWIVTASLDSAALLAVVALVWLAIGRRAAPQTGYWLFMLVVLKLLLPVSVPVPEAVARWTPSAFVLACLDRTRGAESSESASPANASRTKAAPIAAAALDSPDAPERFERSDASPPPQQDVKAPNKTAPRAVAAASDVARSRDSQTSSLSFPAMLMIAWLASVAALFVWLIGRQWRFRWRVKRFASIDAARVGVDLEELRRTAGVASSVRIVESDEIDAPAVWGLLRPTIILPRGIASSMAGAQLRWVLLHELAHVRRFDLAFTALQRAAAALHFFNPAVWVANRMVDRLREYACDDFAVALGEQSTVEPAETFLQVLRFASGRRSLRGALGVFGLETRASIFARVRRLLDSERPIQTRLGPWAVCGLLAAALIALPNLRAASNAAQAEAPNAGNQTASRKQARQDNGQRASSAEAPIFELHVVGPDGKPVPQAHVYIRTDPHPTDEQILTGKFVKQDTYGTRATADDSGRLRVKRPPAPGFFNLDLTMPGYAPYWAGWSSGAHPESIPVSFTAELDAGWSVGGVIVDAAGTPIKDVRVRPSIEFKKRPGDTQQLGVGTNLKTDAGGKWRFDSVPASQSDVFVEIDHPDFRPLRRNLTRSEFGIEPDSEPTARITLETGLTVSGKITDETGKPIAGALIRTRFFNDIRKTKSDANGVYRLVGCEPLTTKIVVSAPGRATDMKELRPDESMGPVDFQMKPGGHVRIRVLDERGKPIPKARIFFQGWRGRFQYFEFKHVGQYTDENGVWEWNEAPLDEFQADICRPDGMQLAKQPLVARDEEYVFRPPPALVVSGKVIDADTKQPIARFRVVPGVRFNESHMSWRRDEQFAASEGKYRLRQTRGEFAHLVRIEADGYLPGVSRDIKSDEGNVTIDFALKKGKNVTAQIVTPDGRAAAGAQVALGVDGSQIMLRNGKIYGRSSYCSRVDADAAGVFEFPAQDGEFQLVIMHSSGYAHLKATGETMPATIPLKAWARVEGTFRIGKEPVPNVPITINFSGLSSYGKGVPTIHTQQEATTGKDGRFVFERVLAGRARIGRQLVLTVEDGAKDVTSSCMLRADFPAGETTRFDLGGSGVAVFGELQPRAGFEGAVNWQFALVDVRVLDGGEDAPGYTATVDREGQFRIDDMPSGSYALSVRFSRDSAGDLPAHRFTLSPAQEKSEQPLDLGELKLKGK